MGFSAFLPKVSKGKLEGGGNRRKGSQNSVGETSTPKVVIGKFIDDNEKFQKPGFKNSGGKEKGAARSSLERRG